MESDRFPFRRRLSLCPILAYWRSVAEGPDPLAAAQAVPLVAAAEAVPALCAPIEDLTLLDEHRQIVSALFSAAFPPALADHDPGAALVPYQLRTVFETRAFRELGLVAAIREQLGAESFAHERALSAYQTILEQHYGMPEEPSAPTLLHVSDPVTQLPRQFTLQPDLRFCTITHDGPLPELSQQDRARLLANRGDLALWQELLPPAGFQFEGVVLARASEVTERETISALTREMLGAQALTCADDVDRVQGHLRALIGQPDLQIGLVAAPGGMKSAEAMGRSLLLTDGSDGEPTSLYNRALLAERPTVTGDLFRSDTPSQAEVLLAEQGLRTLVLVPLRHAGRPVGLLELASPTPDAVSALQVLELEAVAPLLATALRRTLNERENRIQAVIKEQYTALHPSVEWRFRQAAARYAAAREAGRYAYPEAVVFSEVFPLYGLADIRGSSTLRNESIEADLCEQLRLAQAALNAAQRAQPLPAFDELAFRVDTYLDELADGIGSGDEVHTLDFLRYDVEPVLGQIGSFGPAVQQAVEAYENALDPKTGTLYKKRKAYEEAVTLLNDAVGAFLDQEEARAQRMCPHYFERYKTDGVDYNIYVGAALIEDGSFAPLHLHNLRLWQLMTTCGIEWKVRGLQDQLPMPLEVAHLVLAQGQPLAVRFRADEKRFDVDGAYNARYEIVKKRIDKAIAAPAGQPQAASRLTQPGHVAVVYAQAREGAEYERYLDYLLHKGYLKGEVEHLDVEDLQGVRGLKALRCAIADIAPEPHTGDGLPADSAGVVQEAAALAEQADS